MKQTLLLDLDDVCCPFTMAYLHWYYFRTGIQLPEPIRYNQHKDIINQYLQVSGIFRHIPLIEKCYETLTKHAPNYNYVVVTSRPPQHHKDTVAWVKDYMPPVDSIIFTDSGSKWRVRGDVIIDDNPEVITSCRGIITTVKMNYEYNTLVHGDWEVNNWGEIDNLLEYYA